MAGTKRERPLLLGFLTLSFLLHLLLFYLLPQHFAPAARPASEPIMVEVVPPPVHPREREPEFAPKREDEDRARETPGKRLGERDMIAKKETAPRGDMPEDSRPSPAPPPPRPKAKPKPQTSRPETPRSVERPQREANRIARERGRLGEGIPLPSPPPPATGPSAKAPDLKSLLQLPPTTVARLEGEWRRKYRPDVEKGNAVWLDTEKDLLISFFQRFKNNIYGVWNYPVQARDRGEQGTCLLRVTINRDGTVADVRLLESSGSSTLDQEAMAAVRKGAPYGSLPRSYEEETLNIFAFFNYTLSRRVIY